MRAPDWAGQYVGIPYKSGGRARDGCDCWGLVALVLGERFGVCVADYDGPLFEGRHTAEAVAEAAESFAARFIEVGRNGGEQPGDGVLLRMLGVPLHIGVVVAPGLMLHVEDKCDSVIENYRSLHWRSRVLNFYRAEALA